MAWSDEARIASARARHLKALMRGLRTQWPKGKKTMTTNEAAHEAVVQGVHPLWQERIRDLLMYVTTTKGHPYGDREFSDVVKLKVTNGKIWPTGGQIMVTREDGKKFSLRMNKKNKKFTYTEIKAAEPKPRVLAAQWPTSSGSKFSSLSVEAQDHIVGHLSQYGVTHELAIKNMESILSKADSYGVDLNKEKDWYRTEKVNIAAIAKRYGVSPEVVTAMVAVTSPRQRWNGHLDRVVKILDATRSTKVIKITQGDIDFMLTKKPTLGIKPGFYKARDLDPTALAYMYGKLNNVAGAPPTVKAIEIARGGNTDSFMKGAKVRSFYSNLMDPDGDDVTIDSWMVRLISPGISDKGIQAVLSKPSRKENNNRGSYDWFAGVVAELAASHSVTHPADMQAMLWAIAVKMGLVETSAKRANVGKTQWKAGAAGLQKGGVR